ncbi:MAG: amino acid-binding protein [Methanomicrobiales archaeon]|nr:amino acid-binding protein [Methanomicrobiales archaeon]
MKLEMKDAPGQLVAALKPVSLVGGNIVAVIHQHDPQHLSDTIDVQIVLELPEGKLETLVNLIRNEGVNILRIGEERLLVRHSVILIGHLMHTDLSDTVDRIDTTGFAEVAELHLVMPAIDQPSSAKITIKSTSDEAMGEALAILREVARQKKLMIIEPLEDHQ